MDPIKGGLICATTLTGLLCGASLDQSIKQLPARHVIGTIAFSAYARAADLKNGVPWYAILGIGAALASIATAILAYTHHSPGTVALPLYLGGLFALCHSLCTSQAAPLYHRQKKTNDAEALRNIFNKFERIQTIRSFFIVLNLACYIWVSINTLAI
ncbi:MAG TPA: hypothetical protein VGS79_20465 [Puia sp.]|nr:hypothetical protein [Puia sp.]